MHHAKQFLTDELAHAERQLARVRRIAAQLEQQLTAQGLSEVEAYLKLAESKAYRQLQRDEITFHQMWLRVYRQLDRLPAQPSSVDQTIAELEREIYQHKPQPFRKPPTPGPNQPCSCGSGTKYKRCCGNPLRTQPLPRAA